MKKFNFFAYIRKFGVLVLAITIVGTLAVYLYCDSKQTYTATAVIQYTNDGIDEGYAPDGSELDVNEIFSSSVIAQAMESLGIDDSLNVIRSRCSVSEIIPEDQQTLNEALLDKGEETTYFADKYRVSLTVDGDMGATYARNVLDAILQSYFQAYTEEYVEQRLEIHPSRNLIENGYDYYDCVYILENDTTTILYYLEDKSTNYPDYRSSITGYTYTDLYDIYEEFNDYVIPELYAKVIDGPQVKDSATLCKTLSDEIAELKRTEEVNLERRDYLYDLIVNYADKNTEILEYHYKQSETDQTDYILKDVDYNEGEGDVTIEYDDLLLEYVEIDKAVKQDRIDRAHKEYLLSVFEDVDGTSGTDESHSEIEALINDYEDKLYTYYDIVSQTSDELNGVFSADYLKMVNSITTYSAINTKLYVAVGFVFFLVLGIVVAVLIGRAGDFVKFLLYTDKKTGLANRESIDVFVDNHSKELLPENFTCIYLYFSNLSELSKKFGYKTADNVLKDFSGLVNAMADENDFVGYNGAGKFVVFMEQCNSGRAKATADVLRDQVKVYNDVNPDYAVQYKLGCSVTTNEGVYEIRKLFKTSIDKVHKKS